MSRVQMSRTSDCVTETNTALDAMAWAAGAQVRGLPTNPTPTRILNASFAGPGDCRPWQDLIATLEERQAILIAAAGNQNTNLATKPMTPASCPGVVTVAATTRTGTRWVEGVGQGSNYGAAVSLAAPGDEVLMLNASGSVTPVDWNMVFGSGSSASAPHVAAIAAMMLGRNPMLTRTNLVNRLSLTARPLGADCVGCGAGLVDAVRALESAMTIQAEREPNNEFAEAGYISSPADVLGLFGTALDDDRYAVDLPAKSTLRLTVPTDAPAANYHCFAIVGTPVRHESCVERSVIWTNSTDKSVRVWITVTPTVTMNELYTVMASWTDPSR
jgi:serine protease